MGERNYVFLENDGIYLYSHWRTKRELLGIVKQALIRGKDRWNDRQCLNAIIFHEMIKNDGFELGGLSDRIWDGQIAIIVNVDKQTVDNIPFEEFLTKELGGVKNENIQQE